MVARVRVTVGPAKGEPGWNVSTPKGDKKFDVKADAVEAGRKAAKSVPGPSQLQIRKANGVIQTEHTYKADPEKYRG